MGNEWIISEAAGAFNEARALLTPSSVEVLILKPTTDATREWEVLWQTDTNWFYSTEQGELWLAETAADLESPMAEATNVQIGEKVFEISPDDITPPDILGGERCYWIIDCQRFAKRSHYAALY